MRRRQQDPILEQSSNLCEYMNGHPKIVLSYARYFGEYPDATNATMTSIDSVGFDIVCKDGGDEREVRVTFGNSIHSVSQVKNALMSLAKEADIGLRRNDPNVQQGLVTDSPSPGFPDDPIAIVATVFLMILIYLEFYPNTKSPLLQWIFELLGPIWIHRIILLISVVHVLEAMTALYFTVVVGNGFFSTGDILQWTFLVLLFGYQYTFKVIPLSLRASKSKKEQ